MDTVQENQLHPFRLGVFDTDSDRAEDAGRRLADLYPHIDVVAGAVPDGDEPTVDVDAAVIARPEDNEIESLYSSSTGADTEVRDVELPTDSIANLVAELSTVVDTIFLYSQVGANCSDCAALVELPGAPALILSPDYYCVYATPSVAETFGVDASELLGRHVDSILRPRGGSTLEERLDSSGESSNVVQFEEYSVETDQWYEISATTFSDVVVLYLEEATVRSLAATDSPARRDVWPHQLPRPAFTLTNDLRVYSWNEEASREFGWSEIDLHHERLPYHPSFERAFADRCAEVVDHNTIRDIDLKIETKEGDLRDVNCSLIPVTDRSGGEKVLGLITEYDDDHRRLGSLRDTLGAIDGTTSREQLVEEIVLQLDDVVRNSYVALFVRDRGDDHLRLAEHTSGALERFGTDRTITPDDEHLWEPFEEGSTRYVPDLDRGVGIRETDVRSELLIPLGEYGLLALGSTSVDAFRERDRAIIDVFADVATTNFRHFRRNDMLHSYKDRVRHLTADLEAATAESAMVREVVNDCGRVASREQFTQAVCESLVRELPAAFASYYEADADGLRLGAWAQSNQPSVHLDEFDGDAVDQFVEETFERQTVQSNRNAIEAFLGETDVVSALGVHAIPVSFRNRTSGVLFVGTEQNASGTPIDRTYLQTLGRITALCLDTIPENRS